MFWRFDYNLFMIWLITKRQLNFSVNGTYGNNMEKFVDFEIKNHAKYAKCHKQRGSTGLGGGDREAKILSKFLSLFIYW